MTFELTGQSLSVTWIDWICLGSVNDYLILESPGYEPTTTIRDPDAASALKKFCSLLLLSLPLMLEPYGLIEICICCS